MICVFNFLPFLKTLNIDIIFDNSYVYVIYRKLIILQVTYKILMIYDHFFLIINFIHYMIYVVGNGVKM